VFTAGDAAQVDAALRAVEMNVAVPCGQAARSFIFVVDTTGSAAGANLFYNNVIRNLTRLLGTIPAPTQFALARFDDYPCAPHGTAVDVPYQLITPFVGAAQIPGFLPVVGPGQGADAPESQVDAVVTALTGRALVPQRAGCGPGVPAGQGAFPAGAERSPTVVFLFTTPRLFHLPGAGKPHVNNIANITALVNVISGQKAAPGGVTTAQSEDEVLASLITVSFGQEIEPAPSTDTTNFKTLLAALRAAGGSGATFDGGPTDDVCVAKRACVYVGGDSACLDPGDVDTNGDNLADACGLAFQVCDINQDNSVDRDDINLIFQARNAPAVAGDPRDVDGDGLITVNDARVCTMRCTKPGCAP
jgi:hypothetical protein